MGEYTDQGAAGAEQLAGSGMERRLTLRLVKYWENLRAERAMPTLTEIKPKELSEIWQDCFILKIKAEGESRLNYSYIGANIEKMKVMLLRDDPPC